MAAKQASTDTSTKPAFAWLVYQGKTGESGELVHEGDHAIAHPSRDPLVVSPGLNKIDAAEAAAFDDVPAFKRRIDAGEIVKTDEHLVGYTTPGKRRELVEITASGQALEHMLELEKAKPLTGTPRERRDASLVELLERRIARAQPALHLGGLHGTRIVSAAPAQAAAG
jgi:hypothetical protein